MRKLRVIGVVLALLFGFMSFSGSGALATNSLGAGGLGGGAGPGGP